MNFKTKVTALALACIVPLAFANLAAAQKEGPDGIEIPGLPKTAPTEQRKPQPGPSVSKLEFIASFGDPDQVSGAPTNIDKNSSYSWPTNGFPAITTDTDIINSNKMRGFSITGYPAFHVDAVNEATLRVDVYLHMSDGLWMNDALAVWDDTLTSSQATGLIWGNSSTGDFNTSLTPFLKAHRGFKEQWVTFLFDLTPGSYHGIYVYGIDQFGRPDPNRYYGLWKNFTAATSTRVLEAASNGNLHGLMQDDCPLSYAELVIKAN